MIKHPIVELNFMKEKSKESNEIVTRLIIDHESIWNFCQRVRKGIAMGKPQERLMEYVDDFWNSHMRLHIRAEEEILFALKESILLNRAFEEHKYIKTEMDSCLKTKRQHFRNELPALIDFIENHLFFEENELFPFISKSLSNWQVRIIAWQLIGIPIGEKRKEYSDRFWIN